MEAKEEVTNDVQISIDQQKELQRLLQLRDNYLLDYEVVGDHTAKHFTGEYDDNGDKIFKDKEVYTGMFQQLILRKKWKDATKYNPDGTMKDAELEKYRQEYLNGELEDV